MYRSRNEYIDILRRHAELLHSKFGITSMQLFGSVARNEHHDGSDIDLFVEMPPQCYNYIAAAQYLEDILGCSVDLIKDHRGIRPLFRQQIEEDGVNIIPAIADSKRLATANT